MRQPLTLVLILPIALASCKKTGGEASDATSEREQKISRQAPGERERPRSSKVERVLAIPNRGSIRTSEDYLQLEKSIKSLDDSDLAQLLEQIEGTRNTSQDKLTFGVAIAEFARRNPEGVMAWFQPGKLKRDEAGYNAVFTVLAESRPDLLKAWLSNELGKASPEVQAQWLGMGLQSLSQSDPTSAFQFWKELGPGKIDGKEAIGSIFTNFGAQSPDKALALAEANLKGADLDYARYNIAAGTTDHALRLEIAEKMSDPSYRGSTIAGTLSAWMEEDPLAALEKLKELDPKVLQTALATSTGSGASLLAKLGKDNPDTLVSLLNNVVASSSTEPLFRAAVESLAVSSPDKAITLIESMPDGEMKTKMLGSQFSVIATKDSTAAVSQASQLTDPASRKQAYESIGEVVGQRGVEESLKVAGAMAPEDRKAFLGNALFYVAYGNPKDAANLLASGNVELDDQKKQTLLSTVGSALTRTDTSEAQEWLTKLPEEQQPHAMKGIASQLAQSDIKGLSVMLGTLPHDRSWEAGVKVLIDNIKGSDPERAAQWQQLLTQAGYK